MINLNFFPSRRIALYMARLFVIRSLAVLAGLVVILMTLDLLGNSAARSSPFPAMATPNCGAMSGCACRS